MVNRPTRPIDGSIGLVGLNLGSWSVLSAIVDIVGLIFFGGESET